MVNFVQTSTRLKKLQKLALSSVNFRLLRRYVGSAQISILDYGCGAGDTLAAFAKFFKASELWGCDVEASYIEYTRSRVLATVKFFDLSSEVVQEEPEMGSLDVVLLPSGY